MVKSVLQNNYMAAEVRDLHRSQYRRKSRRHHSYPLMSDRDQDFRDFLYLVECGTLQLPSTYTHPLLQNRPPIQEQGDNVEAEKMAMQMEAKRELVKAAQEMVVSNTKNFTKPETEVNLEVQPVVDKLSVAESSGNLFGSLLVTGR